MYENVQLLIPEERDPARFDAVLRCFDPHECGGIISFGQLPGPFPGGRLKIVPSIPWAKAEVQACNAISSQWPPHFGLAYGILVILVLDSLNLSELSLPPDSRPLSRPWKLFWNCGQFQTGKQGHQTIQQCPQVSPIPWSHLYFVPEVSFVQSVRFMQAPVPPRQTKCRPMSLALRVDNPHYSNHRP